MAETIPMNGALFTGLIAIAMAAVSAQPALEERQITLPGASVHLRCGGERQPGQPVVILEAGAFNASDTWRDVHGPIAAFSRVCAHDRPGRGKSGPAPAGLDARGYIDLLRAALQTAGEAPPYVVVGHSLGGLMAQLFAVLHPADVSGLVLVDSSHQDQVQRMSALPARMTPRARPLMTPEPVSVEQFAQELARTPRWRLATPLIVVTRSRWSNGTDSEADAARLKLWMELQRDLATRSTRGELIAATHSGHYVQRDEPRLVIDAVRRVLDAR